MLSIDSECWSLRYHGGRDAMVTQRATKITRWVPRHTLPDDMTLALMSEYGFSKVCREAFHGKEWCDA